MTQYSVDTPSQNPPQTGGPNEVLCRLIESIGTNAVEDKAEELQRYQQRLGAEVEAIRATSQLEQVKASVENVIELMAQHNDGVKADYRVRTNELGRALRMMVETITEVSTSSQAAVHQLTVIEKNLEEVTEGADAARLRSKLGVCLKMIREHSQILRTQSENRVNHLKTFVASAAPGLQATRETEEPLDPVTGLPTRGFAENLIDGRLASGTDCLIGVVTVNRYNNLHGSYGQEVMDGLMKTVSSQLAQRLPEATTLCRWSAHSFIAITEIVSSYAETAQQWRQVRGLKVEKQVESKTRTALVLLNTALMVEHLRPVSSKRAFIQNVEKFAADHAGVPAA